MHYLANKALGTERSLTMFALSVLDKVLGAAAQLRRTTSSLLLHGLLLNEAL